MNEQQPYQKAQYLTSAAELKQLPRDEGWKWHLLGDLMRVNQVRSILLQIIKVLLALAQRQVVHK